MLNGPRSWVRILVFYGKSNLSDWSDRSQFQHHYGDGNSRRMRMRKVTKDELAAMDADSGRCAVELVDARVDVLGYACLVAIMSMGKGYHRDSETRLHEITVKEGHPTPVVTSAGALVAGLKTLGAKRVSIVAPYMKPLTRLVVDYLE